MKILVNDKKTVEKFNREMSISSWIVFVVFTLRFMGGVDIFDHPFLSINFFITFFQFVFYAVGSFLIAFRKEVKKGLLFGSVAIIINLLYGIVLMLLYDVYPVVYVGIVINIVILVLIYKGLNHIKSLDLVEEEPSTAQ